MDVGGHNVQQAQTDTNRPVIPFHKCSELQPLDKKSQIPVSSWRSHRTVKRRDIQFFTFIKWKQKENPTNTFREWTLFDLKLFELFRSSVTSFFQKTFQSKSLSLKLIEVAPKRFRLSLHHQHNPHTCLQTVNARAVSFQFSSQECESSWKCEGENFRLFYIIDLAGHSTLSHTPRPAIAQRTTFEAFSSSSCKKWDFFIFLSPLFAFHPSRPRTQQRRISMFAYIYLILKDSMRGRWMGKHPFECESENNWKFLFELDTRKKEAKMENSIFFIEDGHWRKVQNCEAEKGGKNMQSIVKQ